MSQYRDGFYPSDPLIDANKFEKQDWTSSEFEHIDGIGALPMNATEPRGLGFCIRVKVDADHAADTVTNIQNWLLDLHRLRFSALCFQETGQCGK